MNGGAEESAAGALASAQGSGLPRVSLFGLRFVSAAMDELVTELLSRPATTDTGSVPAVVTPNVDELVRLSREPDEEVRALYATAEYVIPDGQPIVWASRLAGRPMRERLPGSTLFAQLWPRLASEGVPVLVVAPSSDVAERLRSEHPEAAMVVAPRFDENDRTAIADFAAASIEQARRSRPRYVFVGLGYPQRHRLILALLARWPADLGPAPLCLGVGASLEMHVGLRPRAPHWMQRMGLEWFYRFLREPRRLFARYFVHDLAFFPLLLREVWAARRG